MTTPYWPVIAGAGRQPIVERVDRNLVFESMGGSEYRWNLWPTPRLKYTFVYENLRPTAVFTSGPWSGYSETQAIQACVNAMQGSLLPCYVVDPITGSQVTCRLDTDSFILERMPDAPWWKCTATLYQVL